MNVEYADREQPMIAAFKRLLPARLKAPMRRTVKFFKCRYRRYRILKPVLRGERLKIILGAAETHQDG